jgi:hypothetical protein
MWDGDQVLARNREQWSLPLSAHHPLILILKQQPGNAIISKKNF